MGRFNLPDIQFVEKSAEQIETDIVNRYQTLTGKILTKADPRRKFIQSIVLLLSQQRNLIDYTGKQNLLSYSAGDNLDHVASMNNTTRLQPTAAKTTFRFTLSTNAAQTIKAGTRGTAGDGIFFETTNDASIAAGQLTADVEAQCTITGAVGNGYLIGEINQLVDPIQWVQSISNITQSQGGADAEDDDSLALRTRQAPESYSVAGPTGAYDYWAKTANPSIVDVYVGSPSPGVVEIRPLLESGVIPGQEILDDVLAICSDRNIRPLTDNVQVLAPSQVSYDLTITYWIKTQDSTIASSIQSNVNQAIEDYKLWQKTKQGRDIDPSELIMRVKNAGAKRVSVALPTYQVIQPYEVAMDNVVTVNYGGLEDE